MLQLDTVVSQLAGHHIDTALRIASAEVLGAVGHANVEAAQVVFDQHGEHQYPLLQAQYALLLPDECACMACNSAA